MTERGDFRRIANRLGIEPRYTDALGQTRETSDETLAALIAAFGLPADPTGAEAALDEQARKAPFGLDPAQLIRAEDPLPALKLHRPKGNGRVAWTCRLEAGGECSGEALTEDGELVLRLPAGLPLGYHQLDLETGGAAARLSLIVAPPACHLPRGLGRGERSWGLTCQLYGLVSAQNWGMGDFSDLAALARAAGSRGAAALGINPLHALFAAEPQHISPYSPSCRTRLNFLYIDPQAVPGFAEDEAVQNLIGGQWFGATYWAARSAKLMDYGAVAACKRAALEALFCGFRSRHLADEGRAASDHGRTFREFQRDGGQSLADFAVFEALHEHYRREANAFSWRDWPAPLRDPRSAAVAGFAVAHRDRVEFFAFLQWEAERQLAAAAESGREAGLTLGLYRDLAVGVDPNGAEAWADQELVAPAASIGAPPDLLSRAGQNWGLAPFNPLVLRHQGYAPFIAALRSNMRHAGVLRIDHVMSLDRLYWIPNGLPARDGAYVGYPFHDLLRLVALESHRHRCAVIGEDLGTVPGGFRETMRSATALSYRIADFERRADGSFIPPADYPALAAASAATHDMPTLKGFWLGNDIAWRARLGLYPDAQSQQAEAAGRGRDRGLLLEALAQEGLFAPERFDDVLPESGEPRWSSELGDAVHAFLARSRARLTLVQLDDVIGEIEQANLPGTTEGHPNWRRRNSRSIEEIATGPDLQQLAALLAAERRRSVAE